MLASSRSSSEGVHSRGTGSATVEHSVESREALLRYFGDFMAVSNAAEDVSSLYGMRPVWAGTKSTSRLVKPAIKILEKIPVSRCAVLHYIGMLTHEATHLYLSKKENPHCSTEYGSVEQAVCELTKEMIRLLLSTPLKTFALEILKWGCPLYVELCKLNNERPIARKAGNAAVALLPFFESCPAVASVIKVTDQAITLLLECAPEECLQIIIDACRHGLYFDWMFLHITATFPAAVAPYLLKIGLDEFKQYVLSIASPDINKNSSLAIETHEAYKQKFLSLIDAFAFLASKHNADLRSVSREILAKGIEQLEDDDDNLISENSDFSVSFLFKLITNSPDVLRFLTQHTYDLVTPAVIVNAAKQLSQINIQCILPNFGNILDYSSFLRQMIFYISSDVTAHIFELALPFAYDDQIFKQLSRMNQPLCDAIKSGAIALVDDLTDVMLNAVHNQQLFNLPEFGLLKRIACDSGKLNECVIGAMSCDEGGQRSKFCIRYLHAFCLATGPTRTWEVITRFILEAKDELQLTKLCALLVTVTPFQRNAASGAVEHLHAHRCAIELEKRRNRFEKRGMETHNTAIREPVDARWIENLRTLNEWEKCADEKNPIKYFGFGMNRYYGILMCDALRWAMDELSRESTIADRETVVHAVCALGNSLMPAPLLMPKYAYKLCAQFASLLILLLNSVGEAEQPSAYSLFMEACGSVNEFLGTQVGYVREQLIIHIFDEALAHAKELFGCSSLNVWEMEMNFANGCAKEPVLESQVSTVEEAESLFEQARNLSLYPDKPVQMAHSGLIGKGARRTLDPKLKESEWARRLIFFDCVQRFCSANAALEPNRAVCKQLALTITDRFCKDGLTGAFIWEAWEFEKEATPKYIAAAKRVNDIPFVWDLMFALADVYPCLWFCIPLLKSLLASTLIQLENSSDQRSLPPKILLDILDKWFLLTKKGQLLPVEMVGLYDVIAEVSCHEGFVILLDVWKYFQSIFDTERHPVNMVNAAYDASLSGVVQLIKGNVNGFKDSCRLVIQRNIERLGFLYAVVFAEEVSFNLTDH